MSQIVAACGGIFQAYQGLDNLLLTSTTHSRYTSTNTNIGTTPPRQIGVTLRLDF